MIAEDVKNQLKQLKDIQKFHQDKLQEVQQLIKDTKSNCSHKDSNGNNASIACEQNEWLCGGCNRWM